MDEEHTCTYTYADDAADAEAGHCEEEVSLELEGDALHAAPSSPTGSSASSLASAPSPSRRLIPRHASSSTSSLRSPPPSSSAPATCRSGSSIDLRSDYELLASFMADPLSGAAYTSTTLDLSGTLAKKARRPLKSLRALTTCTQLTQLNVSGHALTTLDGLEVHAPRLTALCVARNHLKRLEPPLFSLTVLKTLDLSGNFISHIPRGISALAMLESLNLAGNNLGVLKEVDALAPLGNLHACHFGGNPFCSLPTYRDYVVAKLVALERLDEHAITAAARDKSRRRFTDALFSKEKCLREADAAHTSQQNRLRQQQHALEAENVRLKSELQLKSKLLQNKSVAWSTATEQLLQLQQAVALRNLEQSAADAVGSDSEKYMEMERGVETDRTVAGSVMRGEEFEMEQDDDRSEDTDFQYQGNNDLSRTNERQSPTDHSENIHRPHARSLLRPPRLIIPMASSERSQDAPQLGSPPRWPGSPSMSMSGASLQPNASPQFKKEHLIARNPRYDDNRVLYPHEIMAYGRVSEAAVKRSSSPRRLSAIEDTTACSPHEVGIQRPANENNLLCQRGDYRTNDTAHPSPSAASSQRPRARSPRPALSPASKAYPLRSRASYSEGELDREHVIRQIQALQSCKQSLVMDIAAEEQVLHALKTERMQYSQQIERVECELQGAIVKVDATPNSRRQQQERRASPNGRQRKLSNRHDEAEMAQAKLEVLRRKFQLIEEKEQAIEATIVRMTKRVLHDDIHQAKMHGAGLPESVLPGGSFDKEIFALTHQLQLVIVQKEDLHLDMSRLMQHLRDVSGRRGEAEELGAEATHTRDNEFSEPTNDGQQGEQQTLSAKSNDYDYALTVQRQELEALKKKHRDVCDRIATKENMLASLIAELKDVENELTYINELHGNCAARAREGLLRRTQSLDSQSTSPVKDGKESGQTGGTLTDHQQFHGPMDKVVSSADPLRRCDHSPSITPNRSPQSNIAVCDSEEQDLGPIPNEAAIKAPDVDQQVMLKFKELLNDEMLDTIKKDLLARLCRQPPEVDGGDTEGPIYPMELHAAIAVALDTHVKHAMNEAMKWPSSPEKISNPQGTSIAVANTSSSKPQEITAQLQAKPSTRVEPRNSSCMAAQDRDCWSWEDDLDAFAPLDNAKYELKYRYHKDAADESSRIHSSIAQTHLQRIARAWERMKVIENEWKVDSVTGIDLDGAGCKASSLKVKVLGARELPMAHLRTNNLDPYAVVEVVYAKHVLPSSSPATSSPAWFRTHTVRKNVYPVWDEDFEFQSIQSLQGYLRIRVLNDRHQGREQVVGEARIPLRLLIHQKKVLQSFPLRITSPTRMATSVTVGRKLMTTTTSRSPGDAYHGSHSNGSVRLQLQLQFSRLEKCKRAVDDLVIKYLHEHSHLPACIELMTDYKARHVAVQHTNRDASDLDGDNESRPENEDHEDAVIPSPNVKSMLNSTKSENEDTVHSAGGQAHTLEEATTSLSNRSKGGSVPTLAAPSRASETLRPTPSTASTKELEKMAPAKSTSISIPASGSRTTRESKPIDFARGRVQQPRLISSVNLKASSTRHNPVSVHPVARPRAKKMNPDCFDEYSPYHPDFRFSNPTANCSIRVSSSNGRSISYPAASLACSGAKSMAQQQAQPEDTPRSYATHTHHQATTLRIFKSPSYVRREPTTSFPERYIGLDNQMSERLKRIFGRIDAGA